MGVALAGQDVEGDMARAVGLDLEADESKVIIGERCELSLRS